MNRLALALAIVLGITAVPAWAFPPSNPWLPTAADIQAINDKDFDGGTQASSTVRTNIPGGQNFDITWSTGEPFVNTDFTRQVYNFFSTDAADSTPQLVPNDGALWNVEIVSGESVTFKPYTQTRDPDFTFYEGAQPSFPDNNAGDPGVFTLAAGESTQVSIDWNMVNNDGMLDAAERGNLFEIGWQLFGPGLMQDGSTASTVLNITSAIPEPSTLALAGLTGLALLGAARRRRATHLAT